MSSFVIIVSVAGALSSGGCIIDTGDDSATSDANDETGTPQMGETEAAACFESPACDPLASACADSDKCIASDGEFVCEAVAPGSEEAGLGETCGGASGCEEGLSCLLGGAGGCDGGGPGCCVAICDTGAPQCGTGMTCAPMFPNDPTNCYSHVGLCVTGS